MVLTGARAVSQQHTRDRRPNGAGQPARHRLMGPAFNLHVTGHQFLRSGIPVYAGARPGAVGSRKKAPGRRLGFSAMRVRVLDGPDDIADIAAATIAQMLKDCGERATLGLAGGSTPRTTYTRLLHEDVDWDSVHAWVADERWVAPDHPDNNLRMARDTLFDRVPAHVYPVPWVPDGDLALAAAAYEQTLLEVLPAVNGIPHPDVVLLGIGEDGHTASLFPGTAALDVSDRWFVANWVPAKDSWRLTATLPLLHGARDIVFLASG